MIIAKIICSWMLNTRLVTNELICQLFKLIIEIRNLLHILIRSPIINTHLSEILEGLSFLYLQFNILQQFF